jgi:hypothetical protein
LEKSSKPLSGRTQEPLVWTNCSHSLRNYAGPAVADAYTPLPSIDWVSESNAADVLVEVQDAEIPQLEARLGALANQPNAAESVAAAERELQAIESEAAVIAEQEERDGSTPAIAQEVGGLLSNLTALKGAMRGMMGSNWDVQKMYYLENDNENSSLYQFDDSPN